MHLSLPHPANARVVTVAGKRCRIELQDGTRQEAIARGRLYDVKNNGIVVGDFVVAREQHEQWTVDEALPRRNEFVREGLRHERQVLFANVDRVLIIVSLAQPETKTASIDRFLVAALCGGTAPCLVLTKTDLDTDHTRLNEIRSLYEGFDMAVYPVSNETGEGIEAVAAMLEQGISGIVGNSGVGKTSLLNRLVPGLELRVREVSSWSGKGTHTTTAALLVPFGETAALIDTAGMKSFVPYGVTRDNLVGFFPEICDLAPGCRFRNCRHVQEPDCAVREAADNGTLAASRLRSYHRLLEEIG